MTGFSHAVLKHGSKKISVEIRSLNHRYLEASVKLPEALVNLEDQVKKLISTKVKRGKLYITLRIDQDKETHNDVRVDEAKIAFYTKSLRKIAKQAGIKADFMLADLMRLPNIFVVEKAEYEADQWWPILEKALNKALTQLTQMRNKEGAALAKDLMDRTKIIHTSRKQIMKHVPKLIQAQQDKLLRRAKDLAGEFEVNQEKLVREITLIADKSDITEEIVRLGNHIDMFNAALKEKGTVGKKLDFISQEMNREANTITSKAGSFDVSKEVVRIKSEIEKIREQVQNIE